MTAMRTWLLVPLLLLGACQEQAQQCTPTQNIVDLTSDASPIHDPTIIRESGRYYVFSSSALGDFYSSENLREWEYGGAVFDELPDWLKERIPAADHIGSPDIAFYNGRYQLFYQSHISDTCNAATGRASNATLDSSDPAYGWVDHGQVLRSKPFFKGLDILCGNEMGVFNAIDAHFFLDAQGEPWLAIGSTIGGIKALRLDPITLRPVDGARFSTLAQRFLFLNDPIIEAPYVHYRDGFYYLFMSFNHCCRGEDTRYQVRVGRSTSPDGPYYDQRGWPLYLGGGTLLIERDGDNVGTGHADLLKANGVEWLVHHAKNPLEEYRAYLNIREIRWSENGWPTVCES